MIIENAVVKSVENLKSNIYRLVVNSPKIARAAKPSQFCNIKVSDSHFPLLRRPFSVSDIHGDNISFIFDVKGKGTELLQNKKIGDKLNLLGPLGQGFNYEENYDYAIIVAGGLGSAPFPLLTKKISADFLTIVGARTEKFLITEGLKNIKVCTDDGSTGFKGNVVELLAQELQKIEDAKIKLFGCGPTPMLKALQKYSLEHNIDCELSLESSMACGFGICQGCPVESHDPNVFKLICKDGPVFNAKEIKL